MAEKSTLTQVREALSRAKNQASAMKEKGTEYTREGVGTLIVGATAFGAGFADQRYGALDAETGVRVHKTNGAPTTLLVGAAAKVAGAFGVAGEYSFALYRAGDGAIGQGMGTAGRMAGERMRRKAENVSADANKDDRASEKNTKTSKKAA